MSKIVKLKPDYIPLIQKPQCCAVTCLQMIVYRNGYGLQDQEELAREFGVKVDPQFATSFSKEMPVWTQRNLDEGIPTVGSEKRINAFFRKRAKGLCATSLKHSAIPSLKDFVGEHLRKNHDLWVEYHANEIHSGDMHRGRYLHDGLIESLDSDKNNVVLIDPRPDHRQRITVSLSVLDRAISKHYSRKNGREVGFVVVEKKTPKPSRVLRKPIFSSPKA